MEAVADLVAGLNRVIIQPAMLLLFGVALLVFVWGVVQYLWGLNVKGKDAAEGKRHMIWGIVGMFIMFAAVTILRVLQNTVNSF